MTVAVTQIMRCARERSSAAEPVRAMMRRGELHEVGVGRNRKVDAEELRCLRRDVPLAVFALDELVAGSFTLAGTTPGDPRVLIDALTGAMSPAGSSPAALKRLGLRRSSRTEEPLLVERRRTSGQVRPRARRMSRRARTKTAGSP